MGSASERVGMGWQLHTEAFVAADRHSWCDCHEVAASHLFDAERVDPAEDVLLSRCGMVGWSRCFKPIQKHLKNDHCYHCPFFSMDGGKQQLATASNRCLIPSNHIEGFKC